MSESNGGGGPQWGNHLEPVDWTIFFLNQTISNKFSILLQHKVLPEIESNTKYSIWIHGTNYIKYY